MSPFALPVLAGTAVVSSPALYAALGSGTLSPDVALTRVLLCAFGVWAVCSLVASLASKAVATSTTVATVPEVSEAPPAPPQSEAA